MSKVAATPDREKALEAQRATLRAAERVRRIKQAREDYLAFVQLMMPDPMDPGDIEKSRYLITHFHRLLSQQLQKVDKGLARRTIIVMPPGHGKSELAAKKFIPWFIGRDPYRHTMFAGYSDDFAQVTGRSVRDTIISPLYQQVFPNCLLARGSTSNSFFKTEEGGESFYCGIGGSATGRRAHLLIIDDPIKNSEDAKSQLNRDNLWDWFNRVAMTRLADFTASVIIIQTRWHEDDLVGRLTDPTNDHYDPKIAKQWEIFEIPALAGDNDPMGRKPGEALWPEKFNVEYLESAQRADRTGFASLFQGKPNPEDGDFFKLEWFKYYIPDELPDNLMRYCCSDHAVSEKQTRDATVLLPFALDEWNNIYILDDVWWHKRKTNEVTEAMLHLMKRHSPLWWGAENGHISKAIGPFLHARMTEERVYCAIREMTPSKSKMTRAQSIQGRMSMGKVYFPKYAPWLEAAKNELLKFPSGKHDDFVDAISWAGIMLAEQFGPEAIENKIADKEPNPGTFEWIKRSDELEKSKNKLAFKDGY